MSTVHNDKIYDPTAKYHGILVSILIPVYNSEQYVEETIISLLGQTHRNFEVILINDGSTDKTADICNKYASLDSRIHFFDFKENKGLVACLNWGLEQCTGKYIARADADDIYFPGRLYDQLDQMEKNDYVAISGYIIGMDEHGAMKSLWKPQNREVNAKSLPAIEHYLPHPFLMCKKETLVEIGGYRYITHSEDADLFYRFSQLGETCNIPRVLGSYRIHPDSVSGINPSNGRAQAISSQLAAYSFTRVQNGLPDIENIEAIDRVLRSENIDLEQSIEEVIRLAPIAKDTQLLFRFQCVAKYMEQELWRPYLMDNRDAAYIAKTVKLGISSGGYYKKRLIRKWRLTVLSKWKHRKIDNNKEVLNELVDVRILAFAILYYVGCGLGIKNRDTQQS